MKKKIIVTLLSCFLLFSCSRDTFKGRYATQEKGEPVLIINKVNNSYFCKVKFEDNWKDFNDLKPIPQAKLIELFGDNYHEYIEEGLYYGMFFIFKVKKGKTFSGRTFNSDYYFIFGIASNDLYKL